MKKASVLVPLLLLTASFNCVAAIVEELEKDEGQIDEQLPVGLPPQLELPCLMYADPDELGTWLIRKKTALSKDDPSGGHAGGTARSFSLRDHEGLNGGTE